ncbi:MAG: hypothetical protein ACE5IJ_05485, partial [Thermoplasmata archaeon]
FVGGVPLRGVRVELWFYDVVADFEIVWGWSVTDERGHYQICGVEWDDPSVDTLYYLKVYLVEDRGSGKEPGIKILDASTAEEVDGGVSASTMAVKFGEGGEMGVTDPSEYMRIQSRDDLQQDLWFVDVEDRSESFDVREDHVFEGAIVYYHTHQAMRFFRDVLGVEVERRTPVWIYDRIVECGACTTSGGIFLDDEASVWNDGHAPRNREYHEYAHWVMIQIYGAFPPRWEELPGRDFNRNGKVDADANHAGYWENELSSSDAWTEGFATFMALAIADYYRNVSPEGFWQSLLPRYVYPVGHPFPYMVNVETNRKPTWSKHGEEFAVASILWDLYDPVDELEDDLVSMDIQEIWDLASQKHVLPTYYLAESGYVTEFLGDPYTYPTPEDLPSEEFPVEERHIYYVRDLYDALIEIVGPAGKLAIDELFRAHGESVNTFLVYDDYSQPPLSMRNLVTVGDVGSTVELRSSPVSGFDWWSNSITVEVDNQGWGSGVLVEKAVDATGYGYVWVWVDAPEGTEMSILVEDASGEWISSIRSRGDGWRDPYVALLASAQGFAGEYGFVPNPYRNTPSHSAGPSLGTIEKVGLLFHSPGSYEVSVGPVVLILGYPWRPGMQTIFGVGDPGLAPYRPYRRQMPALEGATVQLTVENVPATLEVQVKYGPPYEDLSFKYEYTLTERSSIIGLLLEPGESESRATLTVHKEGHRSSEPIRINSTYYWTRFGRGRHILEEEVELEPHPVQLFPFLLLVGVVIVVSGAFLVLRRRRRSPSLFLLEIPQVDY